MWTLNLMQLLLLLVLTLIVVAQNCTDTTQSTFLGMTQPSVLFRRCTVTAASVIVVNSSATTTSSIEYCAFVGDSYLHVNGTAVASFTNRVTIEVLHSTFREAGVTFSGNFSNASLTLRNNTMSITHCIEMGQPVTYNIALFLSNLWLTNSTSFNVVGNIISTVDNANYSCALLVSVVVHNSTFLISYNNITASGSGNSYAYTLNINQPITMTSSNWYIAYNNMTCTANVVLTLRYIQPITMTSSNWYISYNNMTTKASGVNVNSAYTMDFQQRITVISSNYLLQPPECREFFRLRRPS